MNTFESLNAKIATLGAEMGAKFVADRDLAAIKLLRDEAEALYNNVIDMVVKKVDYPTWYSNFVNMNLNNRYHALDTTGEFTRVVDEVLKLDATGYYFNVIMPLIKKGTEPLIAERDLQLAQMDFVISMITLEQNLEVKLI